ncbi:hypothetical protein CsSME_00052702 [Camellia sinensis var. sinensis]
MDRWTIDKQAKLEGPLPTKPRKLFYFDRVAPSGCDVARARSVPYLADWGDAEIKATLKLFQNSGGYQNEEVDVNFVVDEQMQPFVQSEEMKNINDIQISKIETTVQGLKMRCYVTVSAVT